MISFKKFEAKYTDQVIELILSIQQTEFQIAISRAEQPDLERIESVYQTQAGSFWLAFDDNKVIGTIGLIDIGKGDCALRKMFVNANYRGHQLGVASKLLELALADTLTKGTHQIFFGTISRYHAALRFYEKNGFKQIKKTNLPDSFPLISVDDVFFTKKLT